MRMYKVVWEIDLEAKSAKDAASQALDIQRDPFSAATFFTVTDIRSNISREIELDVEGESL